MAYSKKRSLAHRRQRWHLLIARREKIVEELPHLVGDLDELAEINKEVAKLAARQAAYVAKGREITAKIRSLAKKADNLRGRLGAGIRSKHGFDGLALIQFGFKPRRTKRHLEEESREVAPIAGEEEPVLTEEAVARKEEGRS